MEVRHTNSATDQHGSLTLAKALSDGSKHSDTTKTSGESDAEKAIKSGNSGNDDGQLLRAATQAQAAQDQNHLEKTGVLPSLILDGAGKESSKCPLDDKFGAAQALAQGPDLQPAVPSGKLETTQSSVGAAIGTMAGAIIEGGGRSLGAAAAAVSAGEAHGGRAIGAAVAAGAGEAHGGDTISSAAAAIKKGAEGPQPDNKDDVKKLGRAGAAEGKMTAPATQAVPGDNTPQAQAAKTPESPQH